MKKFCLNKTLHFSSFIEVRSKGKDILYSETEVKKVFGYDIFTKNLRTFAGNGNKELTYGPCLDASFRQPCCLAVECNNVTYVTDAMSASLSMVTTTNNTANFLQNVGALHDTFSMHERGENYKRFDLEEAHYCIISNCVTTLETNQQKIVNDVKEKLTKVLNGPALQKKLLNK